MRKILVVDDNLDYLELLASVLGKYFEVHEATGVKDALRVLGDKEKEIEAICSDYNMRDGTGLDLLEKVRQEGITIPFLLMSGDFCCKTDCDFIEKIKVLCSNSSGSCQLIK